jgi:hypothetical protein
MPLTRPNALQRAHLQTPAYYFHVKKFGALLLITLMAVTIHPAQAHQPVALKATDRTPAAGPLLVDGTVSFAVNMNFSKAKQVRAFRAGFAQGDSLALQLLIYDEKPERNLKKQQLPVVKVTSPSGQSFTLAISERTPFYEPWGKRNYLYLARSTQSAEEGIYSVEITSRAPGRFIVAIGEREVPGEVQRD